MSYRRLTLDELIRALSGLRIRIEIDVPGDPDPQPVEPICRQCGNPASEKSICDRLDCPYFDVPEFLKHSR